MLLGSKTLAQNDKRQYTVNYSNFLDKGRVLVTATVTVPTGTSSQVGAVTFDPKQHKVYFFINAGAINENFTATIQITDSEGQRVNDTVNFVVTNP